MKTLYVCYFGLQQPLVQTQVLPYLRELSRDKITVNLATFEPKGSMTRAEAQQWRVTLRGQGVEWFSLRYHKKPSLLSTGYDIIVGSWFILRFGRREGLDVIHARSHVPMAMALLAQYFGASRHLIFDIRGLLAEEYSDAGIWAVNSIPFRVVKSVERIGILKADQIVVLTERFRDWLTAHKLKPAEQIEVIPCCVDLTRLANSNLDDTGSSTERFEVVYAGSVTGLYLFEEMGRFFLEFKKRVPGAFFRVLTFSSPTAAREVLRRVGLEPEDFWIGAVAPADVAAVLGHARVGLSFRTPSFSQIAASPTKIPEYLAAGLPVVSNAGIGDVDTLLETERVGVVVRDFTAAELARTAEVAQVLASDAGVSEHCVEVAMRHFDLQRVGAKGYRNVYRRIAARNQENLSREL